MRNAWLPAVMTLAILGLGGCDSAAPTPDPMAQHQFDNVMPAPDMSGMGNFSSDPAPAMGDGGSGAAAAGAGMPGGEAAATPGDMATDPYGGMAATPNSGMPGAQMNSGQMPGGSMPGGNTPGAPVGSPPPGVMGGMPGDMMGMMGGMPGDMMGMMGGMPDAGAAAMAAEDMAGYAAGMAGMSGMAGGSGMPGYGGMPGGPNAEPPRELTYAEKAHQAFQQGQHKEGFRFLFADFLTNDTEARSNYEKMQWVPALQRPTIAVRWGVGIEYSSGNYDGDPKPIGTTQTASGGGRGGRGGGGGAPGAGSMDSMAASMASMGSMGGMMGGMGGAATRANRGENALVEKYTGDLGKAILEEFNKRLTEGGKFGRVLVDVAKPFQLPGGGRANPGMGGMAGMGGMPAGYPSAYDSGAAGAGYGMMGGMGGMGGMPGAGGGQAANDDPDKSQQIVPGLVMLGVAKREELLDRARDEGTDVMIFFNVSVSENRRNGIITNSTRSIVYDVAKREPVKDTPARALNNMKVQNDRDRRPSRDPVDDVVEQLFAFIDEHLTMNDLPKGLNPENTRRRVALLLQSEAPVWERLNEVRFYRSRSLLSQSDLEKAYEKMLGEDLGAKMAKGNEETKQEAMATLLGES